MANPSLSLLKGDPTTWGIPPVGKTFVGINAAGQIVLKQNDGTITAIESGDPSLHKQDSVDGTITVTPTTAQHTEILNIAGIARTSPVLIGGTSLADGSRCVILFKLPATSGIILDIYNGASIIAVVENQTGDVLKAAVEFVLDDGDWVPLRETIPAYTPVS